MPFFHLEDLPVKSPLMGTRFRVLGGERMSLSHVDLEPNVVVPEHAHPHEQITVVLEGELRFSIEGEETVLTPGMVAVVPPNARHASQAGPQGARVLDVFSPPREDLLQMFA